MGMHVTPLQQNAQCRHSRPHTLALHRCASCRMHSVTYAMMHAHMSTETEHQAEKIGSGRCRSGGSGAHHPRQWGRQDGVHRVCNCLSAHGCCISGVAWHESMEMPVAA